MEVTSFIIQGKPIQIKRILLGAYAVELLVFGYDNKTLDILIPKYLVKDLSESLLKLEKCSLLVKEYKANKTSRFKFVELQL